MNNHHCQIETRPEQHTVAVRTHTPVSALATVVGEALRQVMQYVGAMGAQATGAPFVAYYNMDMENLDIAAGFPWTAPCRGRGHHRWRVASRRLRHVHAHRSL